MNKKINWQIVIAVLTSIMLFAGAVFIITYKPNKKMITNEYSSTSEIVTTDPIKTAVLYIKANGTIGDHNKITDETLNNYDIIIENTQNRIKSLNNVKEATIPGSPLINGSEESNIKKHTNDTQELMFYYIDNIKTSDKYNEGKLSVFTETGPVEYESVNVDVEFDSILKYFTAPSDTSYDGTYSVIENKENFKTVVTLVKSGDLWFVYDILNSELDMNARFATWSGINSFNINFENDKQIDTVIVK